MYSLFSVFCVAVDEVWKSLYIRLLNEYHIYFQNFEFYKMSFSLVNEQLMKHDDFKKYFHLNLILPTLTNPKAHFTG